MAQSERRRVSVYLAKSDDRVLQEMKEEEGIVQDTEMIMRILNEAFFKHKMKKDKLA
ncbi:MAG: hypothetical protein GYA60_01940 [Candidatus Methanofastidiosa archaeon]|nr:hypothetical protein [Candidatus Methanofastidiosa archaeon]